MNFIVLLILDDSSSSNDSDSSAMDDQEETPPKRSTKRHHKKSTSTNASDKTQSSKSDPKAAKIKPESGSEKTQSSSKSQDKKPISSTNPSTKSSERVPSKEKSNVSKGKTLRDVEKPPEITGGNKKSHSGTSGGKKLTDDPPKVKSNLSDKSDSSDNEIENSDDNLSDSRVDAPEKQVLAVKNPIATSSPSKSVAATKGRNFLASL